MNAKLEIKAIGSRHSTWGEGPVWWNEHLYYVDIEGRAIIRLQPETGNELTWQFDQRIGCVAPCSDGRLLYAGDKGIAFFDPSHEQSEMISDPEAHLSENRFNDGKCDPQGRFWAGTISLKKNQGTAALYCLNQNKVLTKKVENLTNSNGLAWSSNGSQMFHIDTPTKTIKRYTFDPATGEISEPTILVNTEDSGIEGSPDGMTIDQNNNLWVAFCHGGCVACFSSNDGALMQLIKIPVIETTSCTFGGQKLNRLFVTTGIKKDTPEENAGKIFVIDGLPISGHVAHNYKA